MPLNAKQELFCLEYLKDRNATQAAIRAGYSEKTAHAQGCRLLKNAEAAQFMAQQTLERAERTKIDADWVLKEASEAYMHCKDNGELNVGAQYLKMVGNHNDVSAFTKRIEVSASSELEALFQSAATGHVLPGDLDE